MKKGSVIINSIQYSIDVFVKEKNRDEFIFSLQFCPIKGENYPLSFRETREFIQDEINNDRDINYIEEVTFRIAINHSKQIIENYPKISRTTTRNWLKEAKHQIDAATNLSSVKESFLE